jgi:hypothetical protein
MKTQRVYACITQTFVRKCGDSKVALIQHTQGARISAARLVLMSADIYTAASL